MPRQAYKAQTKRGFWRQILEPQLCMACGSSLGQGVSRALLSSCAGSRPAEAASPAWTKTLAQNRVTAKFAEDSLRTYLCPRCRQQLPLRQPPFTQIQPRQRELFAPFYYAGFISQAILRLKFASEPVLAEPLALLLGLQWRSAFPKQAGGYAAETAAVIPLPLGKQRQRERGYNQGRLLAEHFAALLQVPVCPELLLRTRETGRQSEMPSRSARFANVAAAFALNPQAVRPPQGSTVILLDDVCTSGASLDAAAQVLVENHYRVKLVVLAHENKLEHSQRTKSAL